jgi:hypothetical protein
MYRGGGLAAFPFKPSTRARQRTGIACLSQLAFSPTIEAAGILRLRAKALVYFMLSRLRGNSGFATGLAPLLKDIEYLTDGECFALCLKLVVDRENQ